MVRINERVNLPSGEYQGTWSAYVVTVVHYGVAHTLTTDVGVRGRNCLCRVIVHNGQATVEAT
jgi:hypothetical protein